MPRRHDVWRVGRTRSREIDGHDPRRTGRRHQPLTSTRRASRRSSSARPLPTAGAMTSSSPPRSTCRWTCPSCTSRRRCPTRSCVAAAPHERICRNEHGLQRRRLQGWGIALRAESCWPSRLSRCSLLDARQLEAIPLRPSLLRAHRRRPPARPVRRQPRCRRQRHPRPAGRRSETRSWRCAARAR